MHFYENWKFLLFVLVIVMNDSISNTPKLFKMFFYIFIINADSKPKIKFLRKKNRPISSDIHQFETMPKISPHTCISWMQCKVNNVYSNLLTNKYCRTDISVCFIIHDIVWDQNQLSSSPNQISSPRGIIQYSEYISRSQKLYRQRFCRAVWKQIDDPKYPYTKYKSYYKFLIINISFYELKYEETIDFKTLSVLIRNKYGQ